MTSTNINIRCTPTSELTLFAPRAALNDDIFAHLAWFLPRPTLLSFSLTCHALHHIALPPLLHTIFLPRGPPQHFPLPALRDFLLADPTARGPLLHALHVDCSMFPEGHWEPWREFFEQKEHKADWPVVREFISPLADILECAMQLHTLGISSPEDYIRNEPRIGAALTQRTMLRVLLLGCAGPATVALLREIRAPLTDVHVELDDQLKDESDAFLANFATSLERVSHSGVDLARAHVVCPRARNVQYVRAFRRPVPLDLTQLLRLYPAAARMCLSSSVGHPDGHGTVAVSERPANQAALRMLPRRKFEYLRGRVSVLWPTGVASPVRHLVLNSIDFEHVAPQSADVLRDTRPSSLTVELASDMSQDVQDTWVLGIAQGVEELAHLVLHVRHTSVFMIEQTMLFPLPLAKEIVARVPIRLLELKLAHKVAHGRTKDHASLLLPALQEHWARALFETSKDSSLSCILFSNSSEWVRWSSGTTAREGALLGESLSEEQYAQAREAQGLSGDSQDQFPCLVTTF
ncbi:hypothetical protein CERSUDRAFT_123995 [Gelatoporia subvermispora B]|uniref:F-box domain-containing protein n=1 Tax=Ceriporiopsis subvermispora (strain B) TaxID=914234 RepID=M2PL34_CERS8|nr:hypothetical protein CERSUDRAFT_123995 [Gelatoporia subvermispora B]